MSNSTSQADPLQLGRNVRTKIVSRVQNKNHQPEKKPSHAPFVCNCLSCGKVYDCRNVPSTSGCGTIVSQSIDPVLRKFISSGGECQMCGTLVERAAKELGVMPSLDEEGMYVEDTGEKAAYALRDTLVTCDRESAARTTVIDDQNEYYANAWLSDEEREELMRMEEQASSLDAGVSGDDPVTVTFDMLGRKCIHVASHSRDSGDVENELLRVAQDAAMRERPYGGGRSVVGPDAACVGKGISAPEDFLTETFGDLNPRYLQFQRSHP